MSNERLVVYASRLKDSPYASGEDEWPKIHEDKIASLANEIVNGNRTCYLVSGYRGVGKTSFILQVKEKAQRLVDEKRNRSKPNDKAGDDIPECLFIMTNFAKYENQKSLLRRMIRDVYLVYKKTCKDEVTDQKKKEFNERLEELYTRTFQDVKTQLATVNSSEVTVSGEWNISETLRKIIPGILGLLGAGGAFYFIRQWTIQATPATVILALLSSLLFAAEVVGFAVKKSRTASKELRQTIEDIYDDEIAGFKFQELLDAFVARNYRLVFVLDELDKVGATELDNLIKEMKPYLLSGKAHFVIVAGQELAYRYLWAYSGDDAVIGSLFSKFYHIPLFSKDNFQDMGMRFINLEKAPTDATTKLSPLFDYLIFKSRRVPRSFVARFRQNIIWDVDERGEEIAYIEIPTSEYTSLQVQALNIIKEIERLIITPKQYEPVLNDYLVTQLFVNAQQMIFRKDYGQTIEDYLSHYSESQELADQAYYQNVEEILRELFSRMAQANIVKDVGVNTIGSAQANKTDPDAPATKGDDPTVSPTKLPIEISAELPELMKLKKEWLSFISNLDMFWAEVVKFDSAIDGSYQTYADFLGYFNSVKAISFSPLQAPALIEAINQPQLLEATERLKSFRADLKLSSINPISFQRQLSEFVLKQIFIHALPPGYSEPSLTGYDAAFVHPTAPDLLIDFRHSEGNMPDRTGFPKMVENLSDYNAISQKGNIVSVIETFFNEEKPLNAGQLINEFDKLIGELNPSYQQKITYSPLAAKLEQGTLSGIVQTIISKLLPYNEFSILKRKELKLELIPKIPDYDYADPQRYLWGRKAQKDGRVLSARVVPIGKNNDSFSIQLRVTGIDDRPLRGFVYFLVHPTFPEEVYKVLVNQNSALLELSGLEAFTAAAVCDEGQTELELDLNQLTDVPKEFHYQHVSSTGSRNMNITTGGSKSVKRRLKK